MVGLGPGVVADEVERTDRLIWAAGWRGDILFRPPNGKKFLDLPVYLARRGRITVMWDIEPESDPSIAGDARAIADHVLARVRPGSIILLHVMYDSRDPSRRALPGLLAELRRRGYRFATLSQMFARTR